MLLNFRSQLTFCSVSLLVSLLYGCSSHDTKPWTSEDIINGSTSPGIIGSSTSYGNQAICNQYKAQCGSKYKEWTTNGEIACACDID